MDVIWLLGQNFQDVGDVGLCVGPRLGRRAGRVEDLRAEDEGVGARDSFLSEAPLAVCNLSVLPATLATNGPVPMNGSAARSRPASAASAGGSMWTRSTSRPTSTTASRASVASPASLTIPISRMPASCRACSPSVMRGVLATGASSRLSGRSDQTSPAVLLRRKDQPALCSHT